jgi:hypothetical protein
VGLPVSARVQQKTKDPDDIYFEIKDSEKKRKKQDWYRAWWSSPDEICPMRSAATTSNPRRKGEPPARNKAGATNRRRISPARGNGRPQAVVAPVPERSLANEKEERSGDAKEGFTHAWEAVSRSPRKIVDWAGQDGVVVDGADGPHTQGI